MKHFGCLARLVLTRRSSTSVSFLTRNLRRVGTSPRPRRGQSVFRTAPEQGCNHRSAAGACSTPRPPQRAFHTSLSHRSGPCWASDALRFPDRSSRGRLRYLVLCCHSWRSFEGNSRNFTLPELKTGSANHARNFTLCAQPSQDATDPAPLVGKAYRRVHPKETGNRRQSGILEHL